MSRSRHHQTGAGLPFAIFVIVVLAVIGLAISGLERSSAEGVTLDVQSTRAFMAAQSGAEIGINRLLPPGAAPGSCANPYFSSSPSLSFSTSALEGCTAEVSCTVDIADGSSYFRVTSVGACGTGPAFASRVVEVGVRP